MLNLRYPTVLAISCLVGTFAQKLSSDSAQESRELAVSIPAPFQAIILPFPLPTDETETPNTICRRRFQYQDIVPVSGMPVWMVRRITWVRTYHKNKRLCCNLGAPSPVLHSCINGYRRDALNQFCAQEMEDDARGARAHPCCYSISSQRYTCFERYPGDVIKPKLIMDQGFLANNMSMDRAIREGGQRPTTEATTPPPQLPPIGNDTASDVKSFVEQPENCVLTQAKVDGMCRHVRQQNSHELLVRKIRIPASSKRSRMTRKWIIFERNARTCCALRSTQRLRCFIAKKREQQDANCEVNNHVCCRRTGLERYRCFESKLRNANGSISTPPAVKTRMRGHQNNKTGSLDRVDHPNKFKARQNTSESNINVNSTETDTVVITVIEEESSGTSGNTTQSRVVSNKHRKLFRQKGSRYMRDSCCRVGTLVRRYYKTNPCWRGLRFLQSKLKGQKSQSKICRSNYFLCCQA